MNHHNDYIIDQEDKFLNTNLSHGHYCKTFN